MQLISYTELNSGAMYGSISGVQKFCLTDDDVYNIRCLHRIT
jgi:hypothetical protein